MFVLYGGPEGGGGEGVVGDLGAGGVTVTPPLLLVELVQDGLYAVEILLLAEVTRLSVDIVCVHVNVERMVTPAVRINRVKETESLALLNKDQELSQPSTDRPWWCRSRSP